MSTRPFILSALLLFGGFIVATPAVAQLRAFMSVPGIPGESKRADHEEEIDLIGIEWGAVNESLSPGTRRSATRPDIAPFQVEKLGDAASVYLQLAALQGRSFDRVIVEVERDSGQARQVKFRYTFEGVRFVSFTTDLSEGAFGVRETVGMVFDRVRVLYVETSDDQSAGDEHEIEYDIAAGA